MKTFKETQQLMNISQGYVQEHENTYRMTGKKWDDVLDLWQQVKELAADDKYSQKDSDELVGCANYLHNVVKSHCKLVDSKLINLRDMTEEEMDYYSEIPF